MHEVQIHTLCEGLETGHLDRIPVRQMLAVPNQKTVSLVFTAPTRGTAELVQIILDTHPQRRLPDGRVRGRTEDDNSQLYRRIASERIPQRQYSADPLLWVLRIRWLIWQATLAHARLQSYGELPAPLEVPAWFTAPTLSYYAMASRACRYSRVQSSDRQLRLRLSNGLLRGERRRALNTRQDYSTCNRLLWLESFRTRDRERAFDTLADANLIHYRDQALPD